LIIQGVGRYLHIDLKFERFLGWTYTRYGMRLLSTKHLISGISSGSDGDISRQKIRDENEVKIKRP